MELARYAAVCASSMVVMAMVLSLNALWVDDGPASFGAWAEGIPVAFLLAAVPLVPLVLGAAASFMGRGAPGIWPLAFIIGLPLAAQLFVSLASAAADPSSKRSWFLFTVVQSASFLAVLVVTFVATRLYLAWQRWRERNSKWSARARTIALAYGIWVGLMALITLIGTPVLAPAMLVAPLAAFVMSRNLFLRVAEPTTPPLRLLFLRTFGRNQASQRLLSYVSHHWTRVGPVRLISSTDVASVTMSASQLADFVTGHFDQSLLRSEAEIETRLRFEPRRFLDGRYPITEFLCDARTWQSCVLRVARDSDVVLMDLRGFTRRNEGCAWELAQLARQEQGKQLWLLVDSTTATDDVIDVASRGVPSGESVALNALRVSDDGRNVAPTILQRATRA
jgi:hypothetical protein